MLRSIIKVTKPSFSSCSFKDKDIYIALNWLYLSWSNLIISQFWADFQCKNPCILDRYQAQDGQVGPVLYLLSHRPCSSEPALLCSQKCHFGERAASLASKRAEESLKRKYVLLSSDSAHSVGVDLRCTTYLSKALFLLQQHHSQEMAALCQNTPMYVLGTFREAHHGNGNQVAACPFCKL